MQVNLDQYRGAVGAFKSCLHSKNIYINISIRMLDILPIASGFLSILLTFIMFLLFSKVFVLPFYSGRISKSWTYYNLKFFISMR